MGKLVLVIVICIFQFLGSKNVAAQQFLWATSSKGVTVNSGIKIINLQDVQKEILGYYEMYDYYYDLSGFSKEGYFEKYESSNSFKTTNKLKWNEFKKTVNGINELTVSCIKTNDGNTSSVIVFIYSKNNFDAIVFSNKIEDGLIKNSNTLLNELTAKPITDVSGIETKLNALTSVQFATSTNQLNTNNLLNSLTALQETKQGQIITLLNAITGMSIDVDLTTDQINLNTDQVETLLNDLTGTNIKVPGFSIPPYTEINLSYYGTTNNLASVSYINNSTTVLNLSFSYATNPPTTNDALLTNVKKV